AVAERAQVIDAEPAMAAQILGTLAVHRAIYVKRGWDRHLSLLMAEHEEDRRPRPTSRAARGRYVAAPIHIPVGDPVAASSSMRNRLLDCAARVGFGLLIFAILATAILRQPPKWLSDFDQSFYLTIAYDLIHHGVFSNGVFDDVDSMAARPPPGMFFGPVY